MKFLFQSLNRRADETDYMFSRRQRAGSPDAKQYYYLKDVEDLELFRAWGLRQRQNIVFLKYHRHLELMGLIELKICIHENSLVKLKHPSDATARVPAQVIRVLGTEMETVLF